MRRPLAVLFTAALLLTACNRGSDGSTVAPSSISAGAETTAAPETSTAPAPTTTTTVVDHSDRPYTVFTPSTYDGSTAMPLVLLLHGFGASGNIQEAYFQLQPLAESKGFLYVHPDGTINAIGKQFWNATDACCGFGLGQVDDSAYLLWLIEQVQAEYNVDPTRIYLVGHSNGGFMSYRMACDHADKIAAIVSLAGDTWLDTSKCIPTEPVSVLQVQGTNDGTIDYQGGTNLGIQYPGAQQTVATWAGYNGCDATPTDSTETLDLEAAIEGAETTVASFGNCPADGAVELWTIAGGPHVPSLTSAFSTGLIDWLFAHPKV